MTEALTVLLDIADGIATVTLNRPDQRNALNLAMCDDLLCVMTQINRDDAVRVVVFKANGPVFGAGADLKERAGQTVAWVRERRRRAFAVYEALAACAKPCLAAVHGAAVGSSAEIASACDFVILSTAASFRYPEVARGTVGATQRLPRIVGKALAKELLFTGRIVEADEAVRIGLANRAVPPDQLDAVVGELARAIAAAPPLAVRLVKRCIDQGVETDLASGIQIERQAIEQALAGEEWQQGVAAFVAGGTDKT
jgi:enoyl-CoA hydratase/carnithine racemase